MWIDADALTPQISGSLYCNRQIIDGEVDRSAVGTEMRYFNGGVSANGILDYDEAIRGLNIASLQGTWQMEDNSVVNVLFDRRKTPLLMLGNALFFQDPTLPLATRLRDLLATATLDALRDRVRATTSNTTQGLIGATTPINKNWQIGADVRLTDVGEILPVPDILPSGQGRNRNTSLGGQLIGTNLYSARDTHVFGASWQRGTSYSLTGRPRSPLQRQAAQLQQLVAGHRAAAARALAAASTGRPTPPACSIDALERRACASPTACSSRWRSNRS